MGRHIMRGRGKKLSNQFCDPRCSSIQRRQLGEKPGVENGLDETVPRGVSVGADEQSPTVTVVKPSRVTFDDSCLFTTKSRSDVTDLAVFSPFWSFEGPFGSINGQLQPFFRVPDCRSDVGRWLLHGCHGEFGYYKVAECVIGGQELGLIGSLWPSSIQLHMPRLRYRAGA